MGGTVERSTQQTSPRTTMAIRMRGATEMQLRYRSNLRGGSYLMAYGCNTRALARSDSGSTGVLFGALVLKS